MALRSVVAKNVVLPMAVVTVGLTQIAGRANVRLPDAVMGDLRPLDLSHPPAAVPGLGQRQTTA